MQTETPKTPPREQTDLMIQRYKVIAPYFFSPYKVGDLVKQSSSGSFYVTKSQTIVDGTPVDVEDYVSDKILGNYPHLFSPLPWWAEREESEMPRYLKDIGDGEMYKVCQYNDGNRVVIFLNEKPKKGEYKVHTTAMEHFLPGTEQEYNDYINSTEK